MAKRGRKLWQPMASIPYNSLTWKSQVVQYDERGEPGVNLHRYYEGEIPIDCVLFRDTHGVLRGILNYYPVQTEWEKPGHINIFVDPQYRRMGIGSSLLDFGLANLDLDLTKQVYTPNGAELVRGYLRSRKLALR